MINIDLSSLVANSGSPKFDGAYIGGSRPSTLWKLAAAYKVGQKLPLKVIYPRPDNETAAFALHRKANTNWQYEVRLCIQGGEAPFRFDIISGPSGATIANEMVRSVDSATGLTLHSLPTDYATLKWPNPVGTANFTIRVTDQSDAYVDAVWSAVTDDTAFIIVDAAAGNDTTGTGTWVAPLQTLPGGVWKNGTVDTAYAQKIVALKNGTYTVYQTTAGNNVSINSNAKPRSYLGINKTGVIFDMSQGHMYGNIGDISFKNITLSGAKTTEANNRIIQISTAYSNYHFCNLSFINHGTTGTVSDDNPACVMLPNNYPTYHKYVSFVDCNLDSTSKFQLHAIFAVDGFLTECNKLINVNFPVSNGNVAIAMKDDVKNSTVRYCTITGPSAGVVYMNQQQGLGGAANQELCYTFIQTTSSSTEAGPVQWNQNATGYDNAANTHCYRNTVICMEYAMKSERWIGGEFPTWSANLHTGSLGFGFSYTSDPFAGSPANTFIAKANISATTGFITQSAARITNLGKKGWEIAST
jgi:hypothetical protein